MNTVFPSTFPMIGGVAPPAITVATVTIIGATAGLPGQTTQLTAVCRDSNGAVVNTDVSWSTLNPDVVTIDNSGLATFVQPGQAAIIASVQGNLDVPIPGNSVLLTVNDTHTALPNDGDTLVFNQIAKRFVPATIAGSISPVVDAARPQSDGRTVPTLADYLKNNAVFNALDYDAVPDGDTETPTDNAEYFGRLCDAVNAVPGLKPVVVYFPTGHYKYGDRTIAGSPALTLEFTRPVRVVGPGVLDYTGTLDFMTMGPTGLGMVGGVTNYQRHQYTLDGPTVTGGDAGRHGIVFRSYVVSPRVQNVLMVNFGSSTGYAIFCQSDNWDTRIHNVTFWTDGIAGSPPRNFVRMNGYRLDGSSDFGQSNLIMTQCQAMNGSGIGIGIYISGVGSRIDKSCSIAGFSPNVWVGGRAKHARVECYTESTGSSGWRTGITTPCIVFGDPASHPDASEWVQGLKLDGFYANLHNLGDITNAANIRLLGPASDTVGLQYATFDRVSVEGAAAGVPIVSLNVLASQIGNSASGTLVNTTLVAGGAAAIPAGMLHTPGVADWTGTDEKTVINMMASDGPAIKAKRVGISLLAGATTDFWLTWTTPFASANYTPTVNVYDFNSKASLVCIRSWDATGVIVRVENTDPDNAIDVGLSGMAILDRG